MAIMMQRLTAALIGVKFAAARSRPRSLLAPRGQNARQRLATLAAAVALVACSAAGPNTTKIVSRTVPDGYGRLYVLREKQSIYSAVPVTISVDGRAVGTLRSGTSMARDLPRGAQTLTVAALLSRTSIDFDLKPGTIYADIAMEPSGLPPPREPGLFSIHFLDEGTATAAFAGLAPSD
jgi:hypothetical protein